MSAGPPDDASSPLLEGQRVDRYLLLDLIGTGGMGRVYRAHDPRLDRMVAIKALRRHSSRALVRLRREAQALARLNHPNVVTVYDVVLHGDGVYVAMELVEGRTLRQWAHDDPRVRARIEAVLDAGAGVAAAHRAGLLHRDLKPGNIIIGNDRRARVMDFGLALGVGASQSGTTVAAEDIADDSLEERLTDHDVVLGTPRYMAPEQHVGVASAASDQFSFCVTAFELLYGAPPFPSDSSRANLAAKRNADICRAPASTVPSGVYRVLCRGLAARPEDRWPTMDDLLDQLRRVSYRRPRKGIWVAAGLTLVATQAGAWWLSTPEPSCRDPATLAGVWDEATREQSRRAVMDTKAAHAGDTWERIEPALDAYATQWIAVYDLACATSRERAILDARLACLATRRSAMAALVETLDRADTSVVDRAVTAVASLPPIDDCTAADETSGAARDPSSTRAITEQAAELARARSLADAGRSEEALEIATGVRTQANVMGDHRLRAQAELQIADTRSALGQWQAAQESYHAAYFDARRADAARVSFEAALGLVDTLGMRQSKDSQAQEWLEHARAELERLGDPRAQLDFMTIEALLISERGEFDRALALHESVLARAEELGEGELRLAEITNNIAVAHYRRGDLKRALVHLTDALQRMETLLGPDHPRVGQYVNNLGGVQEGLGDNAAAIQSFERALAIREAALGPDHPGLAAALTNLCTGLYRARRDEEALEYCERALDLWPDLDAAPATSVGPLLNNTALVHSALGDDAEALRLHQRALVVLETAYGSDHPEVGITLLLIGGLHVDRQEYEAARFHLQRAMEGIDAALGSDHYRSAEARYELGRTLTALGEPDRAVPLLEHALQLQTARDGADRTRFELARALWAAELDRPRAIALANQTLTALQEEQPQRQALVRDVQDWLATR